MVTFGILHQGEISSFRAASSLPSCTLHCARESLRIEPSPGGDLPAREGKQNVVFSQGHHF